jgi:predicted esterase
MQQAPGQPRMRKGGSDGKWKTTGPKAARARGGLENVTKSSPPVLPANRQAIVRRGYQGWTGRGCLTKNLLFQAITISLLAKIVTGTILLGAAPAQETHGDAAQVQSHASSKIGRLRTPPMQQNGDWNPVEDHPANEGSRPTKLPSVNGPCPEFTSGIVMFHPKGAPPNKARLWVGPNPGNGALVFYFHGTGQTPDDAIDALGQNVIDDIIHKGGVVLAPRGHGGYEWVIAHGKTKKNDLFLIDEMVACSIQQAKIDTRHIHATGFSSGATLTSDMLRRRSNYLASASPKSGGFDPYNPVPKSIEPKNQIAVMIYHGGASDTWGNPAYEFYEEQSERMADILKSEGNFVIVCNHGRGHAEPPELNQEIVWQFFQDHPYNVRPKPYASGLPTKFPEYCKIW